MKHSKVFMLVSSMLLSMTCLADSNDRALMSSRLFSVPLEKADEASEGINYDYNTWGSPWAEKDGLCQGYDGGHSGIDFQTKDVAGSLTATRNFYSITTGIVVSDGGDDFNTIAVYDESKNITALYLHADTVDVIEGDNVQVGDVLGVQGSEGAGTAEHVHFEMRSGRRTGSACGASTTINPEVNALKYLVPVLQDGISVTDSVSQKDWRYYRIPGLSLAQGHQIDVEIDSLSADLDLYVMSGQRPTKDTYTCRPYKSGTTVETCTITTSGEWYFGVRGYQSGDFTITVYYDNSPVGWPAANIADTVFNDIESRYPQWFSPHQQSQIDGEYYYRYYPNGSFLLTWNSDLWYNIEGGGWRRWGPVQNW